jgi:sulfatase maturation enzyme AslB (radical SAM superfamily)
MALASWEPEHDVKLSDPGAGRIRCLVDLDAPCNLACSRCRRAANGRPLDRDEALRLVDGVAAEVIASGQRSAVAVFYGGEPLLASDQLLALARAFREPLRKAGVASELGLVTNGTRLDPGTSLRLARAGFTKVSVTLAGTREQHDRRRRAAPPGAPTYRAILDNLKVAKDLLTVQVRYELCEDADLLRLPEFIADLRTRGLLDRNQRVKIVAQPHRSYARQAYELFAPDRLRILQGGNTARLSGRNDLRDEAASTSEIVRIGPADPHGTAGFSRRNDLRNGAASTDEDG